MWKISFWLVSLNLSYDQQMYRISRSYYVLSIYDICPKNILDVAHVRWTSWNPITAMEGLTNPVVWHAIIEFLQRDYLSAVYHRENSPVTQTSPEPTLLSWGGGPREKIFPHPWPHGKPGLIALIRPLGPYCSQNPLILLRCVTEIKFAQNLRWHGNWH